jgi:hypothetical protein
MTKADLQASRDRYYDLVRQARDAESAGYHEQAVTLAMHAWEHVNEMMAFEAKYEDASFKSVPCIDLVLKLAPRIFYAQALDNLGILLKQKKAVDRRASDDLAARLEEARARMTKCHRLWDLIEKFPGIRQDELRTMLGGDQAEWREAVEVWSSMGLVGREPDGGSYRLRLLMDLDAESIAACWQCGARQVGPKRSFLASKQCMTCGHAGDMTLMKQPG